ncbi:hypothetical protein ACWNXI_03505 [Caldibacillus thermoamylovorans]
MTMIIRQLLQTIAAAEETVRRLAELDKEETEWEAYLKEARRQRQFWEYMYRLIAGQECAMKSAEGEADDSGRLELLEALAAAEWTKAQLCQRVCGRLSGAARQASDRLFHQALQQSGALLAMVQAERMKQTVH